MIRKPVLVLLLMAGCQYVPGTEAKEIADAKTRVADQLADPPAARFRNVVVRQNVVCGEVNGKNGFGAYAGFERFSVDRKTGEIEAEDKSLRSVKIAAECLTAQQRAERSENERVEAEADKLADNLEAQADDLADQADQLANRR